MIRSQSSQRVASVRSWIREAVRDPRSIWLPSRLAAVIGGAAGALVGLLIAVSMTHHAVFTQRYQGLIAGAALVLIWLAIGVISGLTVLSPLDDDARSS